MDSRVKNIIEWGYCILIAIILAFLFRYFIGTPTIVRQRSMFPTLQEGERVILNRTFRIGKLSYPEKGEIITFEAPTSIYEVYQADQANPVAKYENEPNSVFSKFVHYILEIGKRSYIKRVIALPGEHVEIKENSVFIDGKKLDEPYIQEGVKIESKVFTDFTVPDGYIFAMGDNREHSTDCRDFGCIPLDKLEGVVVFRFWPFSAFGAIESK